MTFSGRGGMAGMSRLRSSVPLPDRRIAPGIPGIANAIET